MISRRSRSCSGVLTTVVLGAAIFVTAAPLHAEQTPPKEEKPWYAMLGTGVLLESSYAFNVRHPDSATNQFRVFDTEADSLRLDVVELVLQKKAEAKGAGGFRIDAMAGQSIPRVSAASGLFRDDVTGQAKNFDLLQAYTSWVAPVGRGLKIDGGKFLTHMGYEVVEGPDGINDNASRSLLFGWTVPISHTGVRLAYPVSNSLAAQIMVVRGWDNVSDNNGSESVGAQLLYNPVSSVTMALNVMSGPEKPKDDVDQRESVDYWITWKANERLSLAMNADYGNEEGDRADHRSVSWYGVAGYVRLNINNRFTLAIRAETLCDSDGERTGTPQAIRELTFTPAWSFGNGIVLRGDLRHDWSDEPVFQRGSADSRDQTTVSLNVLYVFSR